MAVQWAYITEKVVQDNVPGAIAEARVKAVAELGSETVELYEKIWTPGWVCTTWRLWTPDQPPNP